MDKIEKADFSSSCNNVDSTTITLWQFLLELLVNGKHKNIIKWINENGEFKLIDAEQVAKLWGLRKNKSNMNYDKLSRALRYYYDKNIIKKVMGQKFVYKFVKYPEILKTDLIPPSTSPGRIICAKQTKSSRKITPPPPLPPSVVQASNKLHTFQYLNFLPATSSFSTTGTGSSKMSTTTTNNILQPPSLFMFGNLIKNNNNNSSLQFQRSLTPNPPKKRRKSLSPTPAYTRRASSVSPSPINIPIIAITAEDNDEKRKRISPTKFRPYPLPMQLNLGSLTATTATSPYKLSPLLRQNDKSTTTPVPSPRFAFLRTPLHFWSTVSPRSNNHNSNNNNNNNQFNSHSPAFNFPPRGTTPTSTGAGSGGFFLWGDIKTPTFVASPLK